MCNDFFPLYDQIADSKCYYEDRCKADAFVAGYEKALDEFDRICEEARSHNFGVCDANFVIDVIKAKVKEQLKEK